MPESTTDKQTSDAADSFAKQAQQDNIGFFAEFRDFLKHNKKWWLLPIIIMLILVSGLVILGSIGGGAAAPFIYTLF